MPERTRGILGWIPAFLILSALSFADPSKPFKPSLSLELTGGLDSLAVGDIREAQASLNRSLPWGGRTYVLDNIGGIGQTSGGWEAELKFHLAKNIEFGLAVTSARRISQASQVPVYSIFSDPPGAEVGSFSCLAHVQTGNPILLSVHYSLPILSDRIALRLYVGSGIYSGRMSGSWDYDVFDGAGAAFYFSDWATEKRSTIGFHCGLGVEYRFSKRLALVGTAQYRFAKIDNFSATMDLETNLWPYDRRPDPTGTLYYWGWGEDAPLCWGCGELIVWSGTPPDYRVSFGGGVIRPAHLDFSGYTLRLGIRISLF